MSSPASIKDHPIHPMLVAIPIGLWVFSLVSDIIYAAGWGGPVWNDVAYYTMVGGVIGALLAAIPGFIDYLSINDEKTKRTGTRHLLLNLSIVAMYIVNIVIRTDGTPGSTLPILLSVITVGALLYSGWLGGDMVYEHGMGVELEPDGRLKKGRPRPYEVAIPTEGRDRITTGTNL
jgi:uncharacterized membrane protein